MSFCDDLTQYDTLKSEFNVQINLEVRDLLKMIQKLPPSCNKIFNLHAIDGYNHAEIGEMLGISEGTSKSQLHVARIKLQKMIEEEQKDLKVKQLEKAG